MCVTPNWFPPGLQPRATAVVSARFIRFWAGRACSSAFAVPRATVVSRLGRDLLSKRNISFHSFAPPAVLRSVLVEVVGVFPFPTADFFPVAPPPGPTSSGPPRRRGKPFLILSGSPQPTSTGPAQILRKLAVNKASQVPEPAQSSWEL